MRFAAYLRKRDPDMPRMIFVGAPISSHMGVIIRVYEPVRFFGSKATVSFFVMTHGGCCKAKAQWIPFLSSRLTTKIIQNLQKIRLSLICSWFCHMSFGPGLYILSS